MGELTGVFVAQKSHVKKLIDDKLEVSFGEVLGKHSDVCGSIDEKEIIFVIDSLEAVKIVEELGLETGYNPFDYPAANVEDAELEDPDDETVLEVIERRLKKKSQV